MLHPIPVQWWIMFQPLLLHKNSLPCSVLHSRILRRCGWMQPLGLAHYSHPQLIIQTARPKYATPNPCTVVDNVPTTLTS
eukprot:jgi/Botrbrau1/10570/Bobra.0343s0018.1